MGGKNGIVENPHSSPLITITISRPLITIIYGLKPRLGLETRSLTAMCFSVSFSAARRARPFV